MAALPAFLHPYDAVVLAVSEPSQQYARDCGRVLGQRFADCLVDDGDAPLPAKVAHWKERGVPRIFVVGAKEAEQHVKGRGMPAMLSSGKRRLVDLSDEAQLGCVG